MQIMDMKNLEESSPGFTKSWRNEKKHFEELTLEVFMKWKSGGSLHKFSSYRKDELCE